MSEEAKDETQKKERIGKLEAMLADIEAETKKIMRMTAKQVRFITTLIEQRIKAMSAFVEQIMRESSFLVENRVGLIQAAMLLRVLLADTGGRYRRQVYAEKQLRSIFGLPEES